MTGHRELADEAALAARVRDVLSQLPALVPLSPRTPLAITVLSPLAEGADRLVAREVLELPGARLEAVLPLERASYEEDFALPGSRADFAELLARAAHVRVLPPAPDRGAAYGRAGRYVVDHCDLLIALWDGAPASGRGGTAEVVEYARRQQCPLFWISTAGGAGVPIAERTDRLDPARFAGLERYHAERFDAGGHARRLAAASRRLGTAAETAGFPLERWLEIERQVLPHFVRADQLALRYQRRYLRAGTWVYSAAAAAVAVVAFQTFFLPERPGLLLLEVALMTAILAVLRRGRRQDWHGRWIDYRFLAERFRSALFLAAAGVEVGTLRPPRHLSLAYSARDWMVAAFRSVWGGVPRADPDRPPGLSALRHFLLSAWIDDQVLYHHRTSVRHHDRHRRLETAGVALFALTFLAAALHALAGGPGWWHHLLGFVAIALPAAGGALAAIRTHREYLRNALRSAEMVRHLEELKAGLQAADGPESFLPLVREAEETMLHENEDWRVVVRFHQSELPA